MRKPYNDLAGQKFGKLTVKWQHGLCKDGESTWYCSCDCGGFNIVKRQNLRSGETKSCGCLRRENGIRQLRLYENSRKKVVSS